MTNFEETMHRLQLQHEQLLTRKNMDLLVKTGAETPQKQENATL